MQQTRCEIHVRYILAVGHGLYEGVMQMYEMLVCLKDISVFV